MTSWGVFHQLLRQPAQLVGVVPVHPVAQADGLLGLHGGVAQDARLALAHELLQAVVLDVLLGGEAHFLLDFDLHPQALAVEAVLVAQLAALHGPEALEQVFVGAPPAVVDAHRVVGGDRPVDERPVRVVLVQLAQLLEGAALLPELQKLALLFREIYLGRHFCEWHNSSIKIKLPSPDRDERTSPAVPPWFPPWRAPQTETKKL